MSGSTTGRISLFLAALGMVLLARSQTLDLYENYGSNTYDPLQPLIDARTFVNHGEFVVGSLYPFDTLNTLNYTNRGVMIGAVGFNFHHLSGDGSRGLASLFRNEVNSLVSVVTSEFFPQPGTGVSDFVLTPATVEIAATNVVNRGIIEVAAPGVVEIRGDFVDLSRGGIQILPIEGIGTTVIGGTNFQPDVAISDGYWGGITNFIADSSGILSSFGGGLLVQTPIHLVTNNFDGFVFPSLQSLAFAQPDVFAISNAVGTNVLVQAILAAVPPGIEVEARFTPGDYGDRYTTLLELSSLATNVVTGEHDNHTLYLKDELAWNTNHVVLGNLNEPTYRPATYEVARVPSLEWFFGSPPDNSVVIGPELLYQTTYSNTVTTNLYAAYRPQVGFLVSNPVLDSEGNQIIDLLPGRIEIRAGSLELERARFRGEGLVSIQADHVMGSAHAALDGLNFAYDLGTTNEVLEIRNLARDSTERFGGSLDMFSMVWTNQFGLEEEGDPDPDTGEPTLTTNFFQVVNHVMVVDALGMVSDYPVFTHDFDARGRRLVIHDDIAVVRSFHADAEVVEIRGDFTIYGGLIDFDGTNLPEMKRLDVSGLMDIFNRLTLGLPAAPLEDLSLSGTLTAVSQRVFTDRLEHSGRQSAGDRLEMYTGAATVGGAEIGSGGHIDWRGGDLRIRDSTVTASKQLRLEFEGILTDAGAGSDNRLETGDGVRIVRRPAGGDLLGTTVVSSVPRFSQAIHIWPSEDRGVAPEGFEDNLALGRLDLSAPASGSARFLPAGDVSALYVEVLQLTEAMESNWRDLIEIEEGMTLYFAHSNIEATELDEALEGRIRWVSDYAGENSSVPVFHPGLGRTIRVNRSLIESTVIDSDGDGTANAVDPEPFGEVRVTGVGLETEEGEQRFRITWNGAPRSTYLVERRAEIAGGVWEEFERIRNDSNRIVPLTVTDDIADRTRFYRVSFLPE